jgi:transposase
MFATTLPRNKDGKKKIVYVISKRIPVGFKLNEKGRRVKTYKNKQEIVEEIGFIEDFLDQYDDPLAHFKAEAKRITQENKIKKQSYLLGCNYDLSEEYDDSESNAFDANGFQNDLFNYGYAAISAIYHQLEIHYFINNRRRYTKARYNHNMIFLMLIVDRIINQSSKKGAWERRNFYFEKFNFSMDDMYRSLDFFAENKVKLLNNVNKRVTDLYDRHTDLLYYDVTNYYFEIDDEDELRKKGVSKEHRPNPIIQMGLFMDTKGLPVNYELFKGNTNDNRTLIPGMETLGFDLDINNLIYVADKGMMSGNNIRQIRTNKSGYVISYSIRKASKEFKDYVLNQDDYEIWKKDDEELEDGEYDFKCKSRITSRRINFDIVVKKKVEENGKMIMKEFIQRGKGHSEINERQIIFYSKKYAKKAKKDRAKSIEKAKNIAAGKYGQKILTAGAMKFVKRECYNTKTGEINSEQWNDLTSFDEDLLKEEEKLDGYYAIMTNVIGLDVGDKPFNAKHRWTHDEFYQLNREVSDSDIIQMYKGLWKIEESFRITKSDLDARPVFVRKDTRIEAHFLICFLSLLILRILEHRLENKYSASQIKESISNALCTHINENNYKTVRYSKLLGEIGDSLGINLRKKIYSQSDLKELMGQAKKLGY